MLSGQELGVEIDEGQCNHRPDEQDCPGSLQAEAEMKGSVRAQQAGGGFDERVADRDWPCRMNIFRAGKTS